MKLHSEYYIEEDFSDLAGPYNLDSKREVHYMNNVIKDLLRGSIEYRVIEWVQKMENGTVDERRGMVQRKGMILPKR